MTHPRQATGLRQTAIILVKRADIELRTTEIGKYAAKIQLRRGDVKLTADTGFRSRLNNIKTGDKRLPFHPCTAFQQRVVAGQQRTEFQIDLSPRTTRGIGLNRSGLHI